MSDDAFTVATARAAARRGELAVWVGDFLASPGSDNNVLAAALAQREHTWYGPLRVPLAALARLAGPEADVRCPVAPFEWEADVGAMEDCVDEGWEPPPLLAEYCEGQLLLQDGNHRYEALKRAGESHAWVVVWCDDAAGVPTERDRVRGSE
jgi:hypothetical protein